MDHVVYVDAKENELDRLITGTKTMIVRGAAGRKLPYGRVEAGDELYLVQNNGEGRAAAHAIVTRVIQSEKLSAEESRALIEAHQGQLQLTKAQMERWSGKRYLVLIEVEGTQAIKPFAIDRSAFGNMDDWLPVGSIDAVRKGL